MNCAFDKEKLSGYYDGELETAERAEVERHIASCSECLRELGELKSSALLVKELPRLRSPRSVAEGVRREISAVGRVHSLARFRRSLLWAAAAAAVLFIGLNVVFFAQHRPEATVALKESGPAVSATPAIGKVGPGEKVEAPKEESPRRDFDRARELDAASARRQESRKNVEDFEKNAARQVQVAKAEELKKAEAQGPRERAAAEPPRAADAKPGAAPAAAKPAAPVAPQAGGAAAPPAAAPPAPAAKASPLPAADKAPAPKEKEAEAAKKDLELKGKQGAGELAEKEQKAPEAALEGVAPAHFTIAALQVAKTRPQLEEWLKKMGVTIPAAPAAPMKMKAAAREAESATMTLELSESQIARLKFELEKQGDARLLSGTPEDPPILVLRGLGGGLLAGKKEAVTGAPAGKVPPSDGRRKGDDSAAGKEETKDARAADELARGKGFGGGQNAPEPRRKIVLHITEVKSLSSDALK